MEILLCISDLNINSNISQVTQTFLLSLYGNCTISKRSRCHLRLSKIPCTHWVVWSNVRIQGEFSMLIYSLPQKKVKFLSLKSGSWNTLSKMLVFMHVTQHVQDSSLTYWKKHSKSELERILEVILSDHKNFTRSSIEQRHAKTGPVFLKAFWA